MLRNALNSMLRRRHFWRDVSFSEIGELYVSRVLRMVGIYLAAGFASVYLYKTGYSIEFILIYWAIFYFFKAFVLAYLSAKLASRIGPKHGILISNIIYIPSMIALGFVPSVGMGAIIVWGIFMSASSTLYDMCYMIDFSKIKNDKNAGKEIGFMNIFEKLAIGISPVVGGTIALFFGPQVIMWLAAVVAAASAMPLLKTSEPITIGQKLSLSGFPWRTIYRNLIAEVGVGFDVVATASIWGLFLVSVVFTGSGNEIYVKLGMLSSVTVATAVVISYVYGKVIDREKGKFLLRYSVILNGFVHASRPFAGGIMSVIYTNIANEIATTGISMSFMRGRFDTADVSGNRVGYLYLVEILVNFGAGLGALACLACVNIFGLQSGLPIFFFVTAVFVQLVGTSKFRIYR